MSAKCLAIYLLHIWLVSCEYHCDWVFLIHIFIVCCLKRSSQSRTKYFWIFPENWIFPTFDIWSLKMSGIHVNYRRHWSVKCVQDRMIRSLHFDDTLMSALYPVHIMTLSSSNKKKNKNIKCKNHVFPYTMQQVTQLFQMISVKLVDVFW